MSSGAAACRLNLDTVQLLWDHALRISKASGLVGAPALHTDAGHEERAITRSISARRVTEAPRRVFGGKNDS